MILLSVLNFAPMAIKTLLYKRERDAGKNQTKKKNNKTKLPVAAAAPRSSSASS